MEWRQYVRISNEFQGGIVSCQLLRRIIFAKIKMLLSYRITLPNTSNILRPSVNLLDTFSNFVEAQ